MENWENNEQIEINSSNAFKHSLLFHQFVSTNNNEKNVDKTDRTSVPRVKNENNEQTNEPKFNRIESNQTDEREKCSTVPLRYDRQTTVVSRVKHQRTSDKCVMYGLYDIYIYMEQQQKQRQQQHQ